MLSAAIASFDSIIIIIIKYAAYWEVHALIEDGHFFFMLIYWQTVASIYFDPQLPLLAPNISCFSNHQETVFFFFCSFHFLHLSFNDIIKGAISSQNMTNPIDFST